MKRTEEEIDLCDCPGHLFGPVAETLCEAMGGDIGPEYFEALLSEMQSCPSHHGKHAYRKEIGSGALLLTDEKHIDTNGGGIVRVRVVIEASYEPFTKEEF